MAKEWRIKMNIKNGQKAVITVDDWFYAKDGRQYKAVWGPCIVHQAESILGLTPAASTNWFLQVGQSDNAMIIAGCRIHYAQLCDERPTDVSVLCLE